MRCREKRLPQRGSPDSDCDWPRKNCSEVGKGLEFEISFQITNKYLEIADVEGRTFYGT